MQISIAIPLLDEEESLPELEAWIRKVMDANNFSYEIVMIDDGSTDTSWQVIEKLSKRILTSKGSSLDETTVNQPHSILLLKL